MDGPTDTNPTRQPFVLAPHLLVEIAHLLPVLARPGAKSEVVAWGFNHLRTNQRWANCLRTWADLHLEVRQRRDDGHRAARA